MNVTQYFKLALKSLRTSKMRAFLTMLGIIIGVAAVIIIISLGNGLTRMVEQRVEKLGVTQIMAYTFGMGDGTTGNVTPQEIYDLVENHPDVFEGVTPWVSAGEGVRRGDTQLKKTVITGVSEAMYRPAAGTTLDGDTLGEGRFLQYVDVQQRKNVCVIGAYVEREAFQGDALGRELLVGGVPYTVIGVLAQSQTTMEEGGGDDLVYVPYENAMQLSGSGFVSLYQLTARTRDTVEQARELLRDLMVQKFPDPDAEYNEYMITTMLEQVQQINAMMGVAMAVLVAIAAISLLVGGIGIMNIMLVSVTERTREIGIRKSLGAKRRDIRWQFIIEAGTTSAAGGLLGIGLGCLVASGIGSILGGTLAQSMGGGITFSATPTPMAVAVSFGVSVGIGVLFGYLPANKAAKLNPIDALRYD